jgi:hypothetical protein
VDPTKEDLNNDVLPAGLGQGCEVTLPPSPLLVNTVTSGEPKDQGYGNSTQILYDPQQHSKRPNLPVIYVQDTTKSPDLTAAVEGQLAVRTAVSALSGREVTAV